MNKKTKYFLQFYLFLVITVVSSGVAIYVTQDFTRNQLFTKQTTLSDPAFYSDLLAIRFYSLCDTQQVMDDPLLEKGSIASAVYRTKP